MTKYHAEIGSSLNGFIMKRAIFTGKASHAGANPEGGVNALNAVNLAMTGINFLRETFRADDAIRVHFYVPKVASLSIRFREEHSLRCMSGRRQFRRSLRQTRK